MSETDGAYEKRAYQVELDTMMGKRAGNLLIQLFGEHFSGVLQLMQTENPVEGKVFADGRCTLSGSLRTKIKLYSLSGEGLLLPERVDLRLRCGGGILPLRGIRRAE